MSIYETAFPLLTQLPKTKETLIIMTRFEFLAGIPRQSDALVVEELRLLLRATLGGEYAEVAHELLLHLAGYLPLNSETLVSFEPIEPVDAVFIASGHQYSLTELVSFHYLRPYRGDWEETPDSKWLMDPYTNERFSALDAAHIVKFAAGKIPIEGLKTAELLSDVSLDSSQDYLDSEQSSVEFVQGSLESDQFLLGSIQGSQDSEQGELALDQRPSGSGQVSRDLGQASLPRTPRQRRTFDFFRFFGCCSIRREAVLEPAPPQSFQH